VEHIIKKKIVVVLVFILLVGAIPYLVSSTEKSSANMTFSPVIDFPVIDSLSYEECNSCNKKGTYSLGCIPIPTWIRSTPVEVPALFLTDLDWRSSAYNGVSGNWLTSVKNQGNCGSCWAFAAIGCLEAMINIAGNNPNIDMDLSEQYMVSCVTSADGCNGGNAYYCYKYMKDDTYPDDGALPESCFPYVSGSGYEPPCDSKCSDWKTNLVKQITNYGHSSGTSAIKSRLSEGPVCLSFSVYEDFYDYTGGIYEHKYGRYEGAHQVVCVGYSDSGGYWICKNSWGSAWGEGGYFKIKYGQCSIESELVYCDISIGNLPPNTPSNPNPANHATNVDPYEKLSWICSDPNISDTLTYDVYFGTSISAPKVSSSQSEKTYNPGVLSKNTKYYWRIVAKDNYGAFKASPTWVFTTKSVNNPPDLPSNPNPSHQTTDVDINIYLSWTGGDPDVGDTVSYDMYFGSMPPLQKVAGNISTASFNPGILANSLTYFWNVVAWDNHGSSAQGPEWHFTTTNATNNPPNTPIITGEINGTIQTSYDYTIRTTDPDQDNVEYLIDWGDNTNSEWIGPYNSDEMVIVSHRWDSKGTYVIKVKARDAYFTESDWMTLTVTMPYSYDKPISQLLEFLFHRFPHTFPLLRHLLGY